MISYKNAIISNIENSIIVSGGGQNVMLLSYAPSKNENLKENYSSVN